MEEKKFKITSEFKPMGDQPKAIEKLSKAINKNNKFQTLIGVTGSGKTFTMANIIQEVQKPTLVITHNKTLAGQLYLEFKDFFKENRVEYFVSYYDYYQPEAYIKRTDTYIEKDASVNDEIDRMRHSAVASLLERKDVVVVASVSSIYGLGSPEDYMDMMVSLRTGDSKDRDNVIDSLVEIQYERNDINFTRGTFRVRGDVLEIIPASNYEDAIRVEFFGDEIEKISYFNFLTGKVLFETNYVAIFPNSFYVTKKEKVERAVKSIEKELKEQIEYFKKEGKLIEAQRIKERTKYDIEMLREIGHCKGIENYSRHLTQRKEGERPYTLLDFFGDDFLIILDESHVMLPQLKAMYAGDKARKDSLIENGFRLPSAYDNRPLKFSEFEKIIDKILFVSATPGEYEKEKSTVVAEQLIRPTGLLDPIIEIQETKNQMDDIITRINENVAKNERVLITTLTKKMAEKLTGYLEEFNIKVKYLHSDIDTLKRTEIIRDLRLKNFDVLVGINLLREGLDIPEVSLILILDADKEGFLRSTTSLIQTIGRASRNKNGKVVLYADEITKSMETAINETYRRRKIQENYNKEHNITPRTVYKKIRDVISLTPTNEDKNKKQTTFKEELSNDEIKAKIKVLEKKMFKLADELKFEEAMKLRDEIFLLEDKVVK